MLPTARSSRNLRRDACMRAFSNAPLVGCEITHLASIASGGDSAENQPAETKNLRPIAPLRPRKHIAQNDLFV